MGPPVPITASVNSTPQMQLRRRPSARHPAAMVERPFPSQPPACKGAAQPKAAARRASGEAG
eukprot:1624314-Pyramimonas_sp.AAC.1